MRPRLRSSARSGEAGFTLLEMLIAISITGIIVVTMGLAVTESLRNSTATSASIGRSILGNFAARYFGADVASATFGAGSVAAVNPPACGTATPALDIQTGDATAVSYGWASTPSGGMSLVRTTCSGTLATTLTPTGSHVIGTTKDPFTSGASCTATSCTLVLTWSNPTYSLTVSGTRWVNATTTTAP